MSTHRTSSFLGALTLPALAAALVAQGHQHPGHGHHQRIDSFRPLSSFNVSGINAEIVDAGNQGRLLVYTDAGAQKIGFVDIGNPSQPTEVTTLTVGGEPTSVSIVGRYAFCTVFADLPVVGLPAPAFLPGKLAVVDLQNPQAPVLVGTVDVGFHPDSVKAKKIGNQYFAVIAVENQPVIVQNGLVTSDDKPGNPNDVGPAGLVQVVRVNVQNPANSSVVDVPLPAATLSAAGCLFPDDPQPEYVAWNGHQVAVTLQENNGVARIDMSNPNQPVLTGVFSTGVVAPRPADLLANAQIDFAQSYPTNAPIVLDGGGNPVPAGSRMPDALAFSPDGSVIYTADEGELSFTGGRGFSTWTAAGQFVGDDDGLLEQAAMVFSHYPEGRSAARGIEVEGIATGRFGNQDFAFVMSERGSFLSVFDIETPTAPRFVQLLPTGLSPEGIVVIPERNLVVTADEVSGTLTIFQGQRGDYRPSPLQPQLVAADLQTPWAALSGLAPGFFPGQFYAVPDNALPTKIVSIRTGRPFAPVQTVLPVLRYGVQATYDGEGLCRDTSIVAPARRGFWIASEGNGTTMPNLLVQVDGDGNVLREIQLPNSIDAGADASLGGSAQGPAGGGRIRSNGYEGCCLSTDGRYAYAAIQREFTGEFATGTKYARIARYDLQQLQNPTVPQNGLRFGGDWQFFYIAFDSNDPVNWPGLSEITTVGNGRFLVIERDKGVGAGSLLKKVYGFNLNGLTPDTDGVPDASDTVTKVLVRDVVDEFSPYEKIEGIGVSYGMLWIGLDNDGGALESRLRFCGWLGHLNF